MDIKSITGGNKIQETSHAEKRHTPSYLNKSEPDTFERTTKTETKKDKNLIDILKDYYNPSGNEEEALEDTENSAEKYTKDPMRSPVDPSLANPSPTEDFERSPVDPNPCDPCRTEPASGFRQI